MTTGVLRGRRPLRPEPVLLYDGDCGFCGASVEWMRRHISHLPAIEPYQSAALAELDTTTAQCRRAVQWIGPTGVTRGGADAIAQVLIDAGGGWKLVGRTVSLPGIATLSAAFYRLVARNRHRLPTRRLHNAGRRRRSPMSRR
jgi:predicted DCC family thiol-disulfide oxidoreductase YuxK